MTLMRNDARPYGPRSPVSSHQSGRRARVDSRPPVEPPERSRDMSEEEVSSTTDDDPDGEETMPNNDSSLRTKS